MHQISLQCQKVTILSGCHATSQACQNSSSLKKRSHVCCANYRDKEGCTFSQSAYNSLVSSLFVFPDRGCVGGLFTEPRRYRSPLSPLMPPHSLPQSSWSEGGGMESKNRPHPEWKNINTWRGSNLHNLLTLPFIVARRIKSDPQHSSSNIQANNNFTYDLFSPQQRDTST